MTLEEQIGFMAGKAISGRREDAGYQDRYRFFPSKHRRAKPRCPSCGGEI
jgi:hypothetical protein